MQRKQKTRRFRLNPFKRKHKTDHGLDLDSAERSLQMTKKINKEMQDTLTNISVQGDQIKRIQARVDDTEVIEEQAEKTLWSIHSLFGAIANEVTPGPSRHDNIKMGDKKIQASEKTRKRMRDKAKHEKKYDPKQFAKKSQTDKILEKIGSNVQEMKIHADAIGEKLDDQNERLSILQDSTGQAADEMYKITGNMKI